MSNGAGLVASGVGRASRVRVAGRLLGRALTAKAFAKVAYEFIVYGGRLSGAMNCNHEVYMVVSSGVAFWGSFLSSEVAGRSRVALRISREVRREVLGPGFSPFGTLAMITLMGWMWSVQYILAWRCIVTSLFQSCSPNSQRGARYLSSFWSIILIYIVVKQSFHIP